MILLGTKISGVGSFLQLIGVLFIFVFVLVITYFTTKWIAGYQKQQFYNKNLRVVETLKLTTNKYIQIIEAGDQYLVVGIGKDEINILATLTPEQMKVLPEEIQGSDAKNVGESFQQVLDKLKQHLPKK